MEQKVIDFAFEQANKYLKEEYYNSGEGRYNIDTEIAEFDDKFICLKGTYEEWWEVEEQPTDDYPGFRSLHCSWDGCLTIEDEEGNIIFEDKEYKPNWM